MALDTVNPLRVDGPLPLTDADRYALISATASSCNSVDSASVVCIFLFVVDGCFPFPLMSLTHFLEVASAFSSCCALPIFFGGGAPC